MSQAEPTGSAPVPREASDDGSDCPGARSTCLRLDMGHERVDLMSSAPGFGCALLWALAGLADPFRLG